MLKKLTRIATSKPLIRQFSDCFDNLLAISDDVSRSISEHKALVALESTMITHGMPWPTNFHTAVELEEIAKEEGATPVTIGIMNGKIKAGFSLSELEELAASINGLEKPVKVSRHNIYNIRNIKYGGTTVSGTMIVAKKLGIDIFATGGIGGVHREVESTMDISADLRELGRTPICVVSSGVKSFLDIPKTLEFLETEGVFVCTLNSKVFPNFYTPSSGIKSPNNFQSIETIAQVIHDMISSKLESGMIVAVPIPGDLEKEGSLIQMFINKSLENAKAAKMTGSYVSPFVLNQINKLSDGKSLMLNVELIKNNVRVGAKLAVELQKLKVINIKKSHSYKISNPKQRSSFAVIGGSIVDIHNTIKDKSVTSLETITPCATYDCTSQQICGGVARNLAEVFQNLNQNYFFLSVLGTDFKGDFIKKHSNNLDFSRVKYIENCETANCSIISCENKDILFHIGNLSIFQFITPEYLKNHLSEIRDEIKLICIDCNLPDDTIEYIIDFGKRNDIKIFVEPTDNLLVGKPLKIISKLKHHKDPIYMISPNISEFLKMIDFLLQNENDFRFDRKPSKNHNTSTFEYIKLIFQNSNLLDFIPNWIVKLGPDGVIFASKNEFFYIKQSIFFVPKRRIVNISGAGDCLASCALSLHFKSRLSWKDSIVGSLRLVKESLMDSKTVPSSMSLETYSDMEIKKWSEEMFERKLLYYRE